METSAAKRIFRFGAFEADARTGELRKQGRLLPLAGQPIDVLLMLLDRPGELVTRAEIQQLLWPDGTFVDFDHSLNTAINKIRDVLGDSAASPRFVETLARRGYRFVAPVEVSDGSSPPVSAKPDGAAQTAPAEPASGSAQAVLTRADQLPQASAALVRSLFLLLQVMYLSFYAISLARLSFLDEVLHGMMSQILWVVVLLIVTAAAGIPTRLYLICATAFGAPGLRENFLKMFPVIFPLDELWALAPFLLVQQIGYGLALASTAALLYAPFAQRSLILMGAGAPAHVEHARH
jgi:cholera toxin transcriptional activator